MKKILIYLSLTFMFISCNKNKNELTIRKPDIVSDKELLQGWKTYVNDSIKVNIPVNWRPLQKDNLLFYVPLDQGKADLYYVVLKTDTAIVSLDNYLREIIIQMSEKDKNFSYQITKINFKNGISLHRVDLYSNEKNIKYKAYCLIYQKDNIIYDFSFKCINDEKSNIDNYKIFSNVLCSFRYKNDLIIDSESYIIKNEEIIKYDNL